MGEENLAQLLRFRPFPPGDPGPEIWRIIQEFDLNRQIQFAGIVLNTQIAMAEAHLDGMRRIADAMNAVKQ
jgi:hypothetical protein